MSYRQSARYGASLENEQRRLQREPVSVWKQQWVVPAGAPQSTSNAPIKILKWVKTADTVKFDEDDNNVAGAMGDETMMSITAPTEPADSQLDLPAMSSSASVMDLSAAHAPAAADLSMASGLATAETDDAAIAMPSSSLTSAAGPSSSIESRQGTGTVTEAAIAAEDSQLLTQASMPASDPLDRPSTQDDLSSSYAIGSSAPLASTSMAEPSDLQDTQDSAKAITLDMPASLDQGADAAASTARQEEDAAEVAMAEQAEAEAQQGGTNDGSLPAQEFLPDVGNP